MELPSDYKISKHTILESKIFEDKTNCANIWEERKKKLLEDCTLCAEFISTNQMSSVKSLESQRLGWASIIASWSKIYLTTRSWSFRQVEYWNNASLNKERISCRRASRAKFQIFRAAYRNSGLTDMVVIIVIIIWLPKPKLNGPLIF